MTEKEIPWSLDVPREKADEKYIRAYFQCKRNRSQRLMSLKGLQDRSITDSTNALIALIDNPDKQDELWRFHEETTDKLIEEYRRKNNVSDDEVLSDEVLRRLENEASTQTSAKVNEWFGQFWSISQSVEIMFVRRDNV